MNPPPVTTEPLLVRVVALTRAHAVRYPAWEVADAYKLLHQACMGPAHGAIDLPTVRASLLREWALVEPDPHGVLLEDLEVHSPLWRLHLRGARARGLDPETVAAAFLEAAESFPPRPDLLAEAWDLVCGEIRAGGLRVVDPPALRDIDRLVRPSFPPLRHSESFRASYAPAYRLVGPSLARELMSAPARKS